jgi:cob(I)alamin adenosyltransferase
VLPALPDARIAEIERWIDEAEAELPALTAFVMPGGSALHVARTVCRRAEREIVALAQADEVASSIIVFMNRLSDLLFVWARRENRHAGADETQWLPEKG